MFGANRLFRSVNWVYLLVVMPLITPVLAWSWKKFFVGGAIGLVSTSADGAKYVAVATCGSNLVGFTTRVLPNLGRAGGCIAAAVVWLGLTFIRDGINAQGDEVLNGRDVGQEVAFFDISSRVQTDAKLLAKRDGVMTELVPKRFVVVADEDPLHSNHTIVWERSDGSKTVTLMPNVELEEHINHVVTSADLKQKRDDNWGPITFMAFDSAVEDRNKLLSMVGGLPSFESITNNGATGVFPDGARMQEGECVAFYDYFTECGLIMGGELWLQSSSGVENSCSNKAHEMVCHAQAQH